MSQGLVGTVPRPAGVEQRLHPAGEQTTHRLDARWTQNAGKDAVRRSRMSFARHHFGEFDVFGRGGEKGFFVRRGRRGRCGWDVGGFSGVCLVGEFVQWYMYILSMMRNFLFVVNIQICQWNAFFQLEPISKHDRFRHHIPPNTIQSKHNPFRSKTAILPDRRTTRRPRLHSPRLRRRHAPPASQTPFPPPIRPFRKSQTRPPCRSPPPRRSSLCRNGAMVSLRL
mmetsp:Transcript_7096/g.14716  ORF Transcript_7096/g.14716 Transcript_7096/m.14716 type:complete len:225 (+) Transcript_7096:597-1271(+)